jgi:PAS domain S-box-containing protein
MAQKDKTKEELAEEIRLLQKRIAELELSAGKQQQQIRILSTAEAVLRESEEKYRIVVENTYDWEYWRRPDGSFIYTSPSCKRITGYSPEDFINDKELYERIIVQEDKQAWRSHHEEISKYKLPSAIEFSIIRLDGETRRILHICQPVFDKEDNYLGIRASNRDITERKRVEAALCAREAEKTLILDNVGDIIAYHDKNMRLVWANQAYLNGIGSITGTPARMEEVRGLHCCEAWKLTKPCIGCPVSVALRTGETNETELTPENQPHWPATQGAWNIKASPVHDAQGNIIGAIEISRNITGRKKTEEALRLANVYNRNLIEASLDPLVTIGPDGKVMDVNKATEAATGYSRQELIGRDFSGYFTEPERARLGYQQVFRVGSVHDYPLEIRHRDGHIIPVLYNASVYRDETGKVVGVFAAARDITELKKAGEVIKELNKALEQRVETRTAELEIANKELEAFSYSVSHDLRAPLRGMDGFSKVLLEDCSDKLDDKGKDYLNRVRAAVKNMSELIDDLLNLSRISRKEMELKPVDMSKIAEKIIADIKEQAPERQVDFSVQEGLTAWGDAHLLEIALQNLFDNAWKFTGTHKSAKIEFGRMKSEGREVYFIRDDGAGFDTKYYDKLFNPFQRLHSEKDFPGTGIGLVIVRRIMERQGGRVWAEAEVEKGATLYFTLGT